MFDVGWNGPRMTGLDNHIGHRIRACSESEGSGLDAHAAPRPGRDSMSASQRVGHGVLIPRRGGAHDGQAVGELASVAERTVQRRADALLSLVSVLDPLCCSEWWTMPHMLAVVALESRHPVAHVIGDERNDPALHRHERMRIARTTQPASGHSRVRFSHPAARRRRAVTQPQEPWSALDRRVRTRLGGGHPFGRLARSSPLIARRGRHRRIVSRVSALSS